MTTLAAAGAGARHGLTESAAREGSSWRAVPALVTRHLVFGLLLLVGVALRTMSLIAYQGAFMHPDSLGYLVNSDYLVPRPLRPMGYAVLLWLLPLGHGLLIVPIAQHLLGLAFATGIYVLLLRLTVPAWLAAAAAAPVLLDSFQLVLEHYVLSDILFEGLLFGAAALLLWHRPVPVASCAGAGALLAGAALTRGAGTLLIVPALAAVVFLEGGRRGTAAMLVSFALPLGLYIVGFHAAHGTYSTTGFGGRLLYSRVAPVADCTKLRVPRSERVLCPVEPLGRRHSSDWYTWSRRSPVRRLSNPTSPIIGRFAKRVILHQPIDYTRLVAADMLRGFSLSRTQQRGEPPVSRLRFLTHPDLYLQRPSVVGQRAGRGHVRPRAAELLRSYQVGGYVPGPLLAAALLAGVVAALGVGRARTSPLRPAAFLFSAMALLLLLTTVSINVFSWRYWVPELVLMPPAGAVAAVALTRRRKPPHDGAEES
jgi:hypothetical protein